MNAVFSPGSVRCLILILIALCCVPLIASTAFSAETPSAAPILQANLFQELVGNRARLIQVSLVIVALGCAVMWWYK